MSAKTEGIIRSLRESLRRENEKKTSAYDTRATIRRIEDGVAWVHIPGGVDETPVTLTIGANVGDEVQVRVSGGRAFLVGNATAPPTDNAYARQINKKLGQQIEQTNVVMRTINRAVQAVKKIADNTNQYFWHTEEGTDTGAHITEIPQEEFLADPETGGGNLLARSNGIAIRDGLAELAQFSAGGLAVNSYDENGDPVEVAHLGYDTGAAMGGGTAVAPYTTLGRRAQNSTIGNYSVAEGYDTEASGFASHAEGSGTKATKYYAHASGIGTIANQPGQTAIGWFNEASSTNTLFEIGNGLSSSSRSNALEVDWDGNVECANLGVPKSLTAPTLTKSSGNSTATVASFGGYGKMRMLAITLVTSAAIPAGSNLWVGTISAEARPLFPTGGYGFVGSCAVMGALGNDGSLTIRATGAQIPTNYQLGIYFTYFLN